jgi:hypothetical protein
MQQGRKEIYEPLLLTEGVKNNKIKEKILAQFGVN